MAGRRRRFWVMLAAGALLSAAFGAAQETKKPKTPAAKSQKKPVLVDVTRVSTDAAVKSAAKKEAKKAVPADGAKDSNNWAVMEFKPAPPNGGDSSGDVVLLKNSKKKKNVHGEVFGTTGAQGVGTQGVGGAVGATTKSGKTSVYVETERRRTTPPH
jgi:hypothetical protein